MKRLLMLLLSVAMIIMMTACSSSSSQTVTYDSIYNEYSAELTKEGAEGLEEFNSEAQGVTDVTALAELANDEVSDLAEEMVEGGEKMAELMTKNGDDYSVYEENFKKLYQVYNDEAMKIYTAYIDKYASTIPGMTDDLKQQMLDSLAAGLEAMAPIAQQ